MPSGRSWFSARNCTLAALTARPQRAVTASATASVSRAPSLAAATAYSSGVSRTICPSARRASSGTSL